MSADYFLEIESHFARRRGTPFVVSAKDWALMKKWSDDGIPLPVVIEALDSVFDKQDAKGKKVNGLGYCRHAVKEMWDERRELQVGAEGATPEEDPGSRLEMLATALEGTPAGSYASRVRELAALRSVPKIEEALIELETTLLESLATEELRAEASQIVFAGLDEKTRARTIEANLRRVIREHYALPRLTVM